ncbi:MAG: HlyD family secretion protein [Xanthobacteraceae bacterium]
MNSAELDTAKVVATAPGRVEGANNPMPVGAAVSGVIAEVLVHEGDRVAAGQLLVRVSCDNIQKELEARKSTLAAAEATFERVVNGPRVEEVAVGIANVGLAEARSEEASISLRRALALVEGVTISKAQLDQSKRDARMSAALLDEARARLALLRAGSRQEDIAEAKARRDAAQALADQATVSLNYCSVRAPVDGLILSTHVTPGQFISTAIPVTLLTLVDDRKQRVRAEVDERDIGKICEQQRAIVAAENIPDVQVGALSEWMSPQLSHRTMLGGEPDKSAHDVREVMLALEGKKSNWPIGLRVQVRFAACSSTH